VLYFQELKILQILVCIIEPASVQKQKSRMAKVPPAWQAGAKLGGAQCGPGEGVTVVNCSSALRLTGTGMSCQQS
jgi:hypothetical protein